MQEKASATFLSKIEQGLAFLSKLLPGRSCPLPSAVQLLCPGPAWLFPVHQVYVHEEVLGASHASAADGSPCDPK